MNNRKLYFGCALFGLSQEHRAKMVSFRETLKDNFDVLEFCPADVPPEEIYTKDIHHSVATADLMLAILDKASLGLGYEMGTMIEKYGKPLLALAQEDSPVSSLIRGITHPKFEFKRYVNDSEILPLLLDFEKRHFPISQSL